MNERQAVDLTFRFVEAINRRDLAELMAEDHVFVDPSGERHAGREMMREG